MSDRPDHPDQGSPSGWPALVRVVMVPSHTVIWTTTTPTRTGIASMIRATAADRAGDDPRSSTVRCHDGTGGSIAGQANGESLLAVRAGDGIGHGGRRPECIENQPSSS